MDKLDIKIVNISDLNYKQIGEIIDKITSEIDTCYLGKIDTYTIAVDGGVYKVTTEILKTIFKVYVREEKEWIEKLGE